MALASAGPSKDRFELERLAEELESREKLSRSRDDDDETHDLPVYVPLSHDNPHLNAETFDVEEFLLSRSHTSLPDLRAELRDYLSSLKEELVRLINDDYEAFISLSTDLKGEGVRLQRLKAPLGQIRSQIMESKNDLQVIQDAIQDKLQKRSNLREEKTLLHLLLKISDSITRLESLLHISSQDEAPEPQSNIPSYLKTGGKEGAEERSQGGHAKHLSRAAAEYTQLLYNASKARSSKCVFVDEVQWKIDRIQSWLSSDLDHLFSTILLTLAEGKSDGKTLSEMEKAKWMTDLGECLRTYDMLGLWRDAEDVLRRELVRGFIKKTVFHGSLASPHSPIVPHTPFGARALEGSSFLTNSQPPRTPYTPFSAFVLKKNPFDTGLFGGTSSLSAPQAHLLDDRDDQLARVYNQILRFVERDLSKIMHVAEKVSLKSTQTTAGKGHGTLSAAVTPTTATVEESEANRDGFQILANVVWAEFGSAIMDELGSVVFAAGRPDEFRKHHETTTAFIRSLEFLAPSVHSIEAMRSHPVYISFQRRWQLPVYFQLRWKEITNKLESALSRNDMTLGSKNEYKPFVTAQAHAVWVSISSCWSAEMYIPELNHSFWRLTLQILSRYRTWLKKTLPDLETLPKPVAALANEKNAGSPISRSGTPIPSQADNTATSAETSSADEALLTQFASAIADIQALCSEVLTMWQNELSMMLMADTDAPPASPHDRRLQPEDVLRDQLTNLTNLIQPMSSHILSVLTRRCCDGLLPVRSIPSQFRAMANRRPPSEPSYFVALILKPVKLFFGIGVGEGPGIGLKDQYLSVYAEEIFETVCQRYIYYLTSMKKTEESLRRLKRGRNTTFSLFGSSNTKADDGKDEERIRTQMILDVNAFGKDAQSLGVRIDRSETFESLRDMVHASFTDDE